jgi:hypothetical protein
MVHSYLLTDAVLETCESPIGFFALASVVSVFSTLFRAVLYTSVLNTTVLPEKVRNDGNGTVTRIGFYVLLLRITGYWSPTLFFPVACLVITELDFSEGFRRILRPIITHTGNYEIIEDKVINENFYYNVRQMIPKNIVHID